MDISFNLSGGRFNLRVAAIIMHQSRLLVMTEPDLAYNYLPGGRIKLHESSRHAMQRELLEELHESPVHMQLLWTVENFFIEQHKQKRFHEICLFYRIKLKPDSLLLTLDAFEKIEGHKIHQFQWIEISQLNRIHLRPDFLAKRLMDVDIDINVMDNGNTLHHFTHIDTQSMSSPMHGT